MPFNFRFFFKLFKISCFDDEPAANWGGGAAAESWEGEISEGLAKKEDSVKQSWSNYEFI